jgi:predicted glycosyltransferase
MCGCTSIVVPDPKVSKEQWLNGSRLNQYGIAYGEDDIPRAVETLPLLLEEIKLVKQDMENDVIKFVKHCNNIF